MVRKSKRNFIISLILVLIFAYVALIWILPNLINALGYVNQFLHPPKTEPAVESSLAPPVLNIPFDATNSSEIDIPGYTTADSEVKLFMEDNEVKIVKTQSDGSFVFQNVELSLGINNIYGKTVDQDGKISFPSKLIRILFDDEEPSLEVNEPEDGKNIIGDRKITISGKTEKGVKVTVNGIQIIVDQEGNFQTNMSLNEGENAFTIKATDSSTNYTEIVRRVNFTP